MIQRWRQISLLCLAATLCSLFVYFQYTSDVFSYVAPAPEGLSLGLPHISSPRPPFSSKHITHPIDELIRDARLAFNQLLGKRSSTVEQAAWRYRERRGRHPPPGFDEWFAAANMKGAIVIEEFFDRIYHDLSPLWGLAPRDMRAKTRNQPYVIRVRNGSVEMVRERETPFERVKQWTRLVEEMMPHIPDLDMAVNHMDETRVLVPWDKINGYMETERKQRRVINVEDATTEFSGVGDVDIAGDAYDPGWIRGDMRVYWKHLAAACSPDSPAHNVSALPSFDVPIEYPKEPVPEYTYKGYVRNATASRDPCLQPHLRGMHGTFIDSISMATTHELMPMFGESKLPQNNDILIPPAVYLNEGREDYNGGSERGGPWAGKKDKMVWRGGASGARNQPKQWWHIHRNRFIQMMNGTAVAASEAGDKELPRTFQLVSSDTYAIPAQKKSKLGEWVSSFADVGFIDFLCDPPEFFEDGERKGKRKPSCSWLDPYYSVAPTVHMKDQFDHKYLPDIDGNSYSGRYRAFLMSTSLPLKSTIYAEWHDDRLFPWLHYAPFDNSFMDIYGIMDYFLHGHDAEAEWIASEGKRWAELVLRREDMMLYVWRLLLEYGRVVDDNRDRLAYVDDLRK